MIRRRSKMVVATPPKLKRRDKSVIAFRGMLKAIPYVGSPLEHFIFGPLTELRIKRIETTLTEVAERLREVETELVVTERFATLLESVIPELSRSISEEKRLRFRDLLVHAAALPEESREWEDALLAMSLLKQIETPGLAILAAITRAGTTESVTLTSRPVPQVYSGEFNYENPGASQHVIPFEWVVVEYWTRSLRDLRIISYASSDARGGFGGVAMSELGKFLVKWTMKK